jgi:hypothetical protein
MRILQLGAVLLTALELVPSGAHLFELTHKIGLSQDSYLIVQQIYRGWALFGIVLIAAIVTNLAIAVALWRRAQPYWSSLAAGSLLAVTLGIFFLWIYPVNQATDNWTIAPADWQRLRLQWELSHAVNAILTFGALCFATLSTLTAHDTRRR